MPQTWRSWREAMAESLYGEDGFYRTTAVPARHFRTASHVGDVWPEAIRSVATHVDAALGEPDDFTVVDIGAGGGELLTGLAATAPERWSLVGVDVAERPPELPARVGWQRGFPTRVRGLVLAIELLDVVPVNVVEVSDDGQLLVVEVDDDGSERLGSHPDADDIRWIERWAPLRALGDRVEVGSRRDEMWRKITTAVEAGLALAVDYAADASRRDGTLTGYRDGHRHLPVPDATMDLTAHVLFESLQQRGDSLLAQREALRRLGVEARAPDYHGDPGAYLDDLTHAAEAAELLNPYSLGSFTWLLHPVRIELPLLIG
jgi:SAM-dependent MidA family methyltransferase